MMRKDAILRIIFQAVDEASSVAGNVGRSVGNLGGAFGPLGAAAGAAFGVVTTGLGLVAKGFMSAFDQAAEFQQTMANINSLLQLSPAMYEKVSTEVQRLGRETRFTVQEAGVAVEALVRGGGTVGDILSGMGQHALNLAAATKGAMDESAKIIMAVGHQYRLTSEEMGSSVNYISGAINNANMTAGQFYDAFSKVGSLGYSMGISMRDLTAAIAQFGQQGFIGESAGTALKTMLIYLTPKTKDAAEAFEKYGLTVNGVNQFYDQATGKLKPLGDVFGILQDKFANMDTEEKVQTFKKLFGIRAQTMAMVLDASIEGAEGFKRFTDIMDKNDAAAQAEARMKSFLGAKEKFKGQLETLAIEVGLPFVELGERIFNGLIPIFEKAQPAIASFSDALRRGIEGLPDKLRELTGIDLSKVEGALSAFDNKEFGAGLRDFLTQVLGPENMKKLDGLAEGIGKVVDWLKDPKTAENAKNIAKELGTFAGTILDIIKGLNDLKTSWNNMFGGGEKSKTGSASPFSLLENFGLGDPYAMGQEARKRIDTLWGTITDALSQGKLPENLPTAGPGGMLDGILGDPYEAGQRTREKLGVFFDGIGTRINEAKPGISKAASDIWQSIQDGLSGAGAAVGGAAAGAGASIGAKTSGIIDGILGSVEETRTRVSQWAADVGSQISTAVSGIGTNISDTGTSISTWFSDQLSTVQSIDWAGGMATVGDSIQTGINNIGAGIGAAFDAIFGPVPEDVQQDCILIRDRIAEIGSEWVTNVQAKLTEISTNVSTKWGEIKTEIQTKLTSILADVTTKWSEIQSNISTALQNIWNDVRLKWDAVLREIQQKLSAILGNVVQKWNEIKDTISTTLSNIVSTAQTKLGELLSAVQTKFSEILSTARAKFDEIKEAISSRIDETKARVVGAVSALVADMAMRWGQSVGDAQAKWDQLRESISTRITQAKDTAISIASNIVSSLQQKWNDVVSTARSTWDRLSGEVRSSLSNMLNTVVGMAGDAASKMAELARGMVDGLVQAFRDKINAARDRFWDSIRSLLDWIKGLLNIASPSTHPIVVSIGAGVAMGIGVAFAAEMPSQAKIMAGALTMAISDVRAITQDQWSMLSTPFRLGDNETALERYRSLRKLGMDMNRTGRGGFVAASSQNYYREWSKKWGISHTILPTADEVSPTGQPIVANAPQVVVAPSPPVTVIMNVDGIEVGRWNTSTSPDLGRQADRSMS